MLAGLLPDWIGSQAKRQEKERIKLFIKEGEWYQHKVDIVAKQRDDTAATPFRRRQCGLKTTWYYQEVFTTLEFCGAGAPEDE